MGSLVLDTNVVIALLDNTDAHHSDAVETFQSYLRRGYEFRFSAVSYSELLVIRGPGSKSKRARVKDFISQFGADAVVPVDAEVAEAAAALRVQRKSLRTPDALIAATADIVGAEALLTTDRSLARLDGVMLVGSAGQ